MGVCSGNPAIDRDWVGRTSYDLRHRTGYYSDGRGIHGSQHDEEFNSTFASTCDSWAKNLNYLTTTYRPYSTDYGLDWIGDVGVGVCSSSDAYHKKGRAFDLTKIQFNNGAYCDMNWSWGQSTFHQKRYLAMAAELRRYFGTVLTKWYNTDHANHIHFTNQVASGAIDSSKRSDTTLVQASCNILNGAGLDIDGVWGSLTTAAYIDLLEEFNLECRDARDSAANKNTFLWYVAKTAFKNKSAGYYQSTSC